MKVGWFVDRDDDNPELWEVVLQVPHGCHELEGIWFHSEEDAESFLEQHVLGVGRHPEEEGANRA